MDRGQYATETKRRWKCVAFQQDEVMGISGGPGSKLPQLALGVRTWGGEGKQVMWSVWRGERGNICCQQGGEMQADTPHKHICTHNQMRHVACLLLYKKFVYTIIIVRRFNKTSAH